MDPARVQIGIGIGSTIVGSVVTGAGTAGTWVNMANLA